MKKPLSSLDLNLLLCLQLLTRAQRYPYGEADERFAVSGEQVAGQTARLV